MGNQEIEPRFINGKTIDAITKKFAWPYENWMQDWPLEISDKIDISVCITGYPNITDDDEKFAFMQGLLYALDEIQDEAIFDLYAKQISELLLKEFDLHKFTIYYWTLYNSDTEDGFNITPLMRDIWNSKANT